jgi:hypothetical protein
VPRICRAHNETCGRAVRVTHECCGTHGVPGSPFDVRAFPTRGRFWARLYALLQAIGPRVAFDFPQFTREEIFITCGRAVRVTHECCGTHGVPGSPFDVRAFPTQVAVRLYALLQAIGPRVAFDFPQFTREEIFILAFLSEPTFRW